MWIRMMKRLFLLTLLACLAGSATAEVTLRFSPADTLLEQGAVSRLSIMCDEVLDLRTIEVFVQFDPSVVASVGGGAGTLFTDSGFMLFKGFELTNTNEWHGYCVVIGSEDYITGPGELFYWDFEALADGVSPVNTIMVDLVAPDATVLPDVTLPATTIIVDDPLSAAPEIPGPGQGLRCYPNPFNPRTEIRFDLQREESVDLAVYDLSGHCVALLHQGRAPQGTLVCTWDGRNMAGRVQPGGMYLFRLVTPSVTAVAKGILVK